MVVSRWLVSSAALVACGLDPVETDSPTEASGTGGDSDADTGDTASSSESTGAALPPEPGPETHGSGTRLRAIELVTPGDGALLLGFYDTELDLDCVFATAPDGVVRCLPWWGEPQGVLFRGTYGDLGSAVFARPARDCKRPIAVVEACMVEPGDEIALATTADCHARLRRATPFRVAAIASASETCVGELLPGQVAYELEPIDPGMYAAASEVDTATTRALVADGGAWVHAFILDDEGRPCTERDGRCVPDPVGHVFVWGEPTCTELAAVSLGACEAPVLAAGPDVALRLVTEELGPAYGLAESDACEPFGMTAYGLGELVDPTSFPEHWLTYEGTGSVSVRMRRRADDGALAVQDVLFDKESDRGCELIWRKGGLQCEREHGLPGPSDTYFDDPSCMVPIHRTQDFSFAVAVPADPQCGNHEVYVPHDAEESIYPDYALTETGECVQFSDTATHYVPGAALPDTGYFVELQRRVD